MTVFVLDNSVAMRWRFDGGAHAKADSILQELTMAGGGAFVPILRRYEVSSVLARAEVVGKLTTKTAAEFLSLLGTLPTNIDEEASALIFSNVHPLAVRYRLTTYDAAYLELAMRPNLPLATFDSELIEACSRAGVTVL